MNTLLVIDQLRADVAERLFPAVRSLKLVHIPRSTPVGHATISTGVLPSHHGISGRRCRAFPSGIELDIDDLPKDPSWSGLAMLRGQTLFERLRSRGDRALVCVAAKAFIPYLFGAWVADVSVYPRTVKPEWDSKGYHLDIIVFPSTPEGEIAVRRVEASLEADTRFEVNRWWPGSSIDADWQQLPWGSALIFRWRFPLAASATRKHAKKCFAHVLLEHAVKVDQYYGRVGLLLATAVRRSGPPLLVQSWFSTDLYGHALTFESAAYNRSLHAASTRASEAAKNGLTVVTSDHGGRWSPRHHEEANDCLRQPIQLPPADTHWRDADMIVGYATSSAATTDVYYWCEWTARLVRLPRQQTDPVVANSFARDRRPKWLVLPRRRAMFGRKAGDHGGGNHGASVNDVGVLNTEDASVPLVVLGTSRNPPAFTDLQDLSTWFEGEVV